MSLRKCHAKFVHYVNAITSMAVEVSKRNQGDYLGYSA